MDEDHFGIRTYVSYVNKQMKNTGERKKIGLRNVLFFARNLLIYFITNFILPQQNNCLLIYLMCRLLVQCNIGGQETIIFKSMKKVEVKKRLCWTFSLKPVKNSIDYIGLDIGNYQWKELLLNIFQTKFIQEETKQNLNYIHI